MTKPETLVWISAAPVDSTLIKAFVSDVIEADEDTTLDTLRRQVFGEPLPRERFPTKLFGEYPNKRLGPQKDFFMAGGFWLVSAKFASVLEKFNLGQSALYPVSVLEYDRETPVGGDYYVFAFGESKTAFLGERSEGRIENIVPEKGLWQFQLRPEDGWAAVEETALEGPDFWVDTSLISAFFFSDRLAEALKEAGVAKVLRLKSVRVEPT